MASEKVAMAEHVEKDSNSIDHATHPEVDQTDLKISNEAHAAIEKEHNMTPGKP